MVTAAQNLTPTHGPSLPLLSVLQWCITVVLIPVVKSDLKGVYAIFSYRKFDKEFFPEHISWPELVLWALSSPSYANKAETSLISSKMDHACLPCSPELCETSLAAQGRITCGWDKRKQEGFILVVHITHDFLCFCVKRSAPSPHTPPAARLTSKGKNLSLKERKNNRLHEIFRLHTYKTAEKTAEDPQHETQTRTQGKYKDENKGVTCDYLIRPKETERVSYRDEAKLIMWGQRGKNKAGRDRQIKDCETRNSKQ